MNIAYSRYLQNALEHSTLTDEEKQGAHAFLKFLSTYKPTGLNVREPDFYGYGDAFGQYGVTYFDKQTLEDYGIDPRQAGRHPVRPAHDPLDRGSPRHARERRLRYHPRLA